MSETSPARGGGGVKSQIGEQVEWVGKMAVWREVKKVVGKGR